MVAKGIDVIADVGSNWRKGPDEPLKDGRKRWADLIEMCAEHDVDVVKGQFLRPTVYPEGSDEAKLVASYAWPEEWLPYLKERCDAAGVEWMCSVFEPEHVALVDPYVKRHKIASFEALRDDLLAACQDTGKPVLVSTGTLSDQEVGALMRRLGARDIPLYCVSKYPAQPIDYNLEVLATWLIGYSRVGGLSDHTEPDSVTAAVLGVAMGAEVIETHVTLSPFFPAPDGYFARSPMELRRYVQAIRDAEVMLREKEKVPNAGEWFWARYDPVTGKRGTAV